MSDPTRAERSVPPDPNYQPQSLDEAEQQRFCRVHLTWAQRYVRRRFGPTAMEYAGLGLVQALRSYDPARQIPLSAWVRMNLRWTAQNQLREWGGRTDTARHRGRQQTFSLLDRDALDAESDDEPAGSGPSPLESLDEAEQLVGALRRIETLEGVARWVVLGRFLADLGNADLAMILGRDARHLGRSLQDARRWFAGLARAHGVAVQPAQKGGGR